MCCSHRHSYSSPRESKMSLEIGGSGVLCLACHRCSPSTYAAGILVCDPVVRVFWYAIPDQHSYDLVLALRDDGEYEAIVQLLTRSFDDVA